MLYQFKQKRTVAAQQRCGDGWGLQAAGSSILRPAPARGKEVLNWGIINRCSPGHIASTCAQCADGIGRASRKGIDHPCRQSAHPVRHGSTSHAGPRHRWKASDLRSRPRADVIACSHVREQITTSPASITGARLIVVPHATNMGIQSWGG